MKRKSNHKLFICFLALSVLCGSFTVFASAKAKSIKASLDPHYTYTFNNQSILAKEPTIIYKNKAYVPVDVLSNALGYNVSIKGNQVAITTPTKPQPQNVTIPKAEIIAIDFAAKTVTIVPAGKSNDMQNQIILNITDQTTITDGKTKKAYNITDLNTGMQVKVVHSAAMTKSIPPQTNAITITLL